MTTSLLRSRGHRTWGPQSRPAAADSGRRACCPHTCVQVADKASEFQGEDIEQILQARTEKRQLGGRAGNTFSTAKFSQVNFMD